MIPCKTILVFAALHVGAVFPFAVSAGEWEEYLALKEALTVKREKLKPVPLPAWLNAPNWEPRPRSDAIPADKQPVEYPVDKPSMKPEALK